MVLYEDTTEECAARVARVGVYADLRITLDHSCRLPVSLESERLGENGFSVVKRGTVQMECVFYFSLKRTKLKAFFFFF